MSVIKGTCLMAALRFVECFPEAEAFNVILLTEEKRTIHHRPRCSRQSLLSELPNWLKLKEVHFFIRPLLSSVVMVDLDGYKGDLETIVRLRPRALTSTSPGNYQAWFMVPSSLASKTAIWVTKQLTLSLGGDRNSAKEGQQGRLPGSLNVKPGKGGGVFLLHRQISYMCEKAFLEITAGTSIEIKGSEMQLVRKPPTRAQAQGSTVAVDRSADDWKMCCTYFEGKRQASLKEATEELNQGQVQS
jgi:hypothetical protein